MGCCVGTSASFQLVEVTTAPGSASAPHPCGQPTVLFGGNPPVDTCSGCTCDTTGVGCTEKLHCFGGANCTGGFAEVVITGQVTCGLTNGVVSSGSCQVSMPPTPTTSAAGTGGTLTPGTWDTQYALCPVEGAPSGCDSGDSCPHASAGTQLCLYSPKGVSACPAGFDQLVKVYTGGEDQQGCNCTCDTTCSYEVKLGAVCVDLTLVDPAACTNNSGTYTFDAKPSVSATPHSAVTGAFAPAAPGTLCCAPPS
jgi:hypothetical protein